MKKLSLYAMFISALITVIYCIKLMWVIETDIQFWRATVILLVSEIGLWCAYYYCRDYEVCKAHEQNQARLRAMFTKPE